jgi:hypothetical protein
MDKVKRQNTSNLIIASVLSSFSVTKLSGDKIKNIPQSVKKLLAIAMIYHDLFLWNSFAPVNLVEEAG